MVGLGCVQGAKNLVPNRLGERKPPQEGWRWTIGREGKTDFRVIPFPFADKPAADRRVGWALQRTSLRKFCVVAISRFWIVTRRRPRQRARL